MESKWLDDFLSLALHKNFSRAADARNITQSALSRRIRLFEGWIGAPLIDRKTYPIGLTETGERLLPHIEEMRMMIDNLRVDVRAPYFPTSEVLTVCMLNTLTLTLFPDLVARLESLGHKFRFRFIDARTTLPDNMDALRTGACDFLFLYAHENVQAFHSFRGFPYLVVASERGIPVSVPDEAGNPVHSLFQSSHAVDYLSYRSHSFFANALPEVLRRGNFRLNTVYESALSAALLAAVRIGLGVAWIPESLMAAELADGTLVRAGPESYDLQLEVRMYGAKDLETRLKKRFWREVSAVAPLGRSHRGQAAVATPLQEDNAS